MPSTDITYCTRECGNMECKRNKEHTKDVYVPLKDYNINPNNEHVELIIKGPLWFSDFKDCKEWRERV